MSLSIDNLISLLKANSLRKVMSERCEVCGKPLFDHRLTHCSDYCLFENGPNGESLSDSPVFFDIDSKPWT